MRQIFIVLYKFTKGPQVAPRGRHTSPGPIADGEPLIRPALLSNDLTGVRLGAPRTRPARTLFNTLLLRLFTALMKERISYLSLPR